MAWVGDHLFSYAQALVAGFTINCPESGETVMNDLREIGPTYYFAPPRVFENLLTQVMIRMEDASPFKRKLFQHFMDVARRCGADILDGKVGVSGGDRLQYWLGNLFIYGPLKNVLGMSRIRVAYTAGAAIGPTCSASTARSASTSSSSTARPRPAPTCACSPTGRSSSTRWAPRRPTWRSSSPTTARSWCAARCS